MLMLQKKIEADNSFKGDINPVPQCIQQLKSKGKKLYELPREVIEIEREARRCYYT